MEQQQMQSLNDSRGANVHVWNGRRSTAKQYERARRHLSSSKHDQHYKSPSSIERMRTVSTSISVSRSSSDDNNDYELWKVKLAGGEYLKSQEDDLHDDINVVHEEEDSSSTSATNLLRRLKLHNNMSNCDCAEEGDCSGSRGSSTATTKASNAYHKTLNTPNHKRFNVSREKIANRGVYHRPIDTYAKELSSRMITKQVGSKSRAKAKQKTTPRKKPAISRRRRPIKPVNSQSSDDSDVAEFKRMHSVSSTFQQNDMDKSTRRNSNTGGSTTASPLLSGIGVDVRSDYNNVDEHGHGGRRLSTPRESVNATCSLPPIITDMMEEIRNSPFNILANIKSSPTRVHNTSSAQRNGRNGGTKVVKSDDEWSVDGFESVEGSLYHSNDDDNNQGDEDSSRDGSTLSTSTEEVQSYHHNNLQEKYDQNLTYRHYHREDLSYHGTEECTSYYEESCPRSSSPEQPELERYQQSRRYKYRDSPFVRRTAKSKRYR